MKITGIILAGGKSRRMGADKAMLTFQGKLLIAHAIDTLTQVADDLLIIANDKAYERFGFPVHPDLYPDCGPLGGICTGLEHSKTQANLVLSCDTPFVSSELLQYLLSKAEGSGLTLCKTEEGIQPLVGMYARSLKEELMSFSE